MLTWNKALKKDAKGFTLIELMVVVIILGVLAAVAIPLYTGYIKNARTSEGVARLGAIMTAAKAYYQRFSRWPADPSDDGFYADFTNTEHFSYSIDSGGGGTGSFGLAADGLDVDGMSGVSITMTCASVSSEAVVSVEGI